MLLRTFNNEGDTLYREFLREVQKDPQRPVPLHLLTNPATSEPSKLAVDLGDLPVLTTQGEAGQWLFKRFGQVGRNFDAKQWEWLSLFLFDNLVVVKKIGRFLTSRKEELKSETVFSHYEVQGSSWRNYRHRVINAYMSYVTFQGLKDKAAIIFNEPLNKHSEPMEHLLNRENIITNPAAIEAATKLFTKNGVQKKGVRGHADKPATIARFGRLMKEYAVIWDLTQFDGLKVIALLPAKEFEHLINELPKADQKTVERHRKALTV